MALVQLSAPAPRVGMVQLDDPATRNSLSPAMREELAAALRQLDFDPEVRCIVIAGSEKVFAAGADVRALAAREIDAGPDLDAEGFWAALRATETPVVAAVSGYALGGGCELALACDAIVADRDARFALPEITLGIIPGGGGTQLLTRAIGKHRAMEYVLTGRQFDADMAASWGIVNLAIGRKAWLQAAVELAATIASRPPLAVRLAKQAVLAADEEALSQGLATERGLFDQAMATEDRVEGMTAFLEKREPDFRGR